MELFKIISVILFSTYYCKGHFIFRNQNNRQSPSIPALNLQSYSEYLKPLYRIRYLSPRRTAESRIDHRTPRPTEIPISKKQTTALNKGNNGMLSVIKNLVKSFIEKLGKSHRIVKKPKEDRGIYKKHRNHALYHKRIPKLIKKEKHRHYGKIPRDKLNNTKQENNKPEKSAIVVLDLANNKEKSNHFKLNDSMILEGTKKRAGYINKMKTKSIFRNIEDNKHFVNIFIFHPNNDNSALIGLRDNLTDPSTVNSTENSIKIPIHGTTKKRLPFTVNDDKSLVGNKDEEFHDNMDTKTIPTVDIISTESIVPDGTVSTTEISVTIVNDELENVKDNNIADNSEDILPSIGYEEEEVVTAKVINSSKVKDIVSTEATPETETTTTEELSITSTSISPNTDLFYTTSADNIVVNELTESLSEKDESIPTSTVVNEITESILENPNDALDKTKDEENLDYQENSVIDDLMEENDIDVTVGPSAVVTPLPDSTADNLTEEVNNLTDYVIEEAEILYDRFNEKIYDTITEMNVDSTEATVGKATTTIEDVNVTTTDVPTTTTKFEETTELDVESKSNIILDKTVESTTIQTLSNEGVEITTRSFNHTNRNFNYFANAFTDDYIEIEYTYNIFLK